MPPLDRKSYPDVRALERGLRILDALAVCGWSNPSGVAAYTDIDRATVYRLLATLVSCGYVARRAEDGRYFLAAKLLSAGRAIHAEDRLIQAASPALAALVAAIHWPSDFAILRSGRLQIVASSHHLTTRTFFRKLVGREQPVVRSALGRAILAAMDPVDRDLTLHAIHTSPGFDQQDFAGAREIDEMVAETHALGYARAVGLVESKIGAIAVPLTGATGVPGAVNIVFFRSAMTAAEAASRFLDPLKRTVAEIDGALAPPKDPRSYA